VAIQWIGGRFRRPSDRAGRRRRSRSQTEGPDGRPERDPAVRRGVRRRNTSIGIGVFLVAVVIGVVAFGYYEKFYSPPRVWAGSVNQVEFSMGDLVARIRVLQGVNRYEGGNVDLSTVPFEYLQNLINAEILRQKSGELGITPTDAEIDQELRREFQPTPPAGQEADPGQLDREFQNNYQTFLTATGLADADFRIIVEERIAVLRLAILLSQQIEDPQEQVEVEWIRLPVDGGPQGGAVQPQDVMKRLELEQFAIVAAEVSQPEGFADRLGYVGWVPPGAFPDLDPILYGDAESGVEALVPGETSQPAYSTDGIYIVRLISGPELQEVQPMIGNKLTLEMVREWQAEQVRVGADDGWVTMHFNSTLYAWVADQVFITRPRLEESQ
jgi:hypothetical protein